MKVQWEKKKAKNPWYIEVLSSLTTIPTRFKGMEYKRKCSNIMDFRRLLNRIIRIKQHKKCNQSAICT